MFAKGGGAACFPSCILPPEENPTLALPYVIVQSSFKVTVETRVFRAVILATLLLQGPS
jgi:hypothetical protein